MKVNKNAIGQKAIKLPYKIYQTLIDNQKRTLQIATITGIDNVAGVNYYQVKKDNTKKGYDKERWLPENTTIIIGEYHHGVFSINKPWFCPSA